VCLGNICRYVDWFIQLSFPGSVIPSFTCINMDLDLTGSEGVDISSI